MKLKKIISCLLSVVLSVSLFPNMTISAISDFEQNKQGTLSMAVDYFGIDIADIIDYHYTEEHPFTVIYDSSADTDAQYYENCGAIDWYVESNVTVFNVYILTSAYEYTYRYCTGSLKEVPYDNFKCTTHLQSFCIDRNPFHGIGTYSISYWQYKTNDGSVYKYSYSSDSYDDVLNEFGSKKATRDITTNSIMTQYGYQLPINTLSGEDMQKLFELGINIYNEYGAESDYKKLNENQEYVSLINLRFDNWNLYYILDKWDIDCESVDKNSHVFDYSFELTDGIWRDTKNPSWDSLIYKYTFSFNEPVKYIYSDKIAQSVPKYAVEIYADGSMKISSTFSYAECFSTPTINVGWYNWTWDNDWHYWEQDIRHSCNISVRGNDDCKSRFIYDTTNNNKLVFYRYDKQILTIPETTFIKVENMTFALNLVDPEVGKTKITILYDSDVVSDGSNPYTVDTNDKQISILNETIEKLRSEVEYWKNKQPICGDTDNDGRVSISDSIILNRYLAGTVDSLPCSDPPPVDESEDD